MSFTRHLLVATGLLVVALAFLAARHWDTVTAMVDNAVTAQEGAAAVADLRTPDDWLAYLARRPEHVSLVVADVTAAGDTTVRLHRQGATPRPAFSVDRLQVLAAYATARAAGRVDPARRIAVRQVAAYALPGVTAAGHRRAVQALRAQGRLDADSTASLAAWVEAAVRHGDRAAADWLMVHFGPETMAAARAMWGLADSQAPRPLTGMVLRWRDVSSTASGRDTTSATAALQAAAQRLQEPAFREATHRRLAEDGTGLTLKAQRTMAQTLHPVGTAGDYARLLARVAAPQTEAARHVQALLEQPVADTVRAPFRAIASVSGAYPGLVSFAGYVRRPDAPPRVVVLLAEDVPLAVQYHLMQTGIDRAFVLRLLSDEAYLAPVRHAFQQRAVQQPASQQTANRKSS